jgi:CheY-like chemotaxis protein
MARRSSRAATLRGVHILLVCDDAERCELFAQALKYAGALITTCTSPDEANTVMERLRVNVLVVELRTAHARARFIAAVRAWPSERGGHVPALALTGSHDDGEALRAAGFQLHLTMPVRAVELCAAVAALAREPAAWPRL